MSLLNFIFPNLGLYGGCGNASLPSVYGEMSRNAMFQSMSGLGIYGYGNNPYYTGSVSTPTSHGTTGGGQPKATVTKEQVDNAWNSYEELKNIREKADKYVSGELKNDEKTLKKNYDDECGKLKGLYDGLDKIRGELKGLKDQLDAIRAQKPVNATEEDKIKLAIHEKQRELVKKENEIKAQQTKIKDAEIELEAFRLAQEGQEANLEKLVKDTEDAYKNWEQLQTKYSNEQRAIEIQKENERTLRQDKEDELRVAGKKKSRSLLNPANWFNYDADGNKTHRANIAKCMRKLTENGREAALAYAKEQGLIKFENGTAIAIINNDQIKDLCKLHNNRDKTSDVDYQYPFV